MGSSFQIVAERLAQSLDLKSDQKVLDVAAGSGNFTLAAAQRCTDVISTDFVASVLHQGERRIRAQSLDAVFDLADAEKLPFESARFDVTGSTFGVMFTLNHHSAASELMRVTRPGGKIGLVNWRPDSFLGQMLTTIGRYVPKAVSLSSLNYWGTREKVETLFEKYSPVIEFEEKSYTFCYRSPEHWLSVFHRYYGPLHYALSALDNASVTLLVRDLLTLIARCNHADDSRMIVPSGYLECIITRGRQDSPNQSYR